MSEPDDQPEDIVNLYQMFGGDPHTYREFAQGEVAPQRAVPRAHVADGPGAAQLPVETEAPPRPGDS
jgi:hypothetical protein